MKIIKETEAHPLTEVEFFIKPYSTLVIFRKVRTGIDLDNINTKIMELLTGGPKSSSDISKFTGLSRQAVVDRLNSLKLLGMIEQLGQGSKTTYKLSNQ